MRVFSKEQIAAVIPSLDIITPIKEGFVAYSQGRCVVPPVGEMNFEDPPGAVHIKYGYIAGEEHYVIKVASGFHDDPAKSLATIHGLMMLFSQKNGEPLGLLVDECYLTGLRTGAAGAIVAMALAPKNVTRIGIVGAGTQGREQLRFLRDVTPCRDVIVWGLNDEELACYKREMEAEGFRVETTRDTAPIGDTCNLIVMVTRSTSPLLFSKDVKAGTHITAVGADAPGKQELEPALVARADLHVVDSVAQCSEFGESQHAIRQGLISKEKMVELGHVIAGGAPGRTSEDQLTIADLTGVAVQDLQIAKAVYEALSA